MKWISIRQEFPPEEKKINSLWFDVWLDNNYRIKDVKFKDGVFFEQIIDNDGDYSHDEVIYDVTHWLFITPP